MPSLDSLQIGQHGRVSKLSLNANDSQRLSEMGLTTGATVKVLKLAPLGDPIEILVRGYHLSLRKAEARSIWVELPSAS
jgi:Fe2+ transport system protein FeoA